ncbi:phosphoglucosamine mutase [Candidatus Woesearchaeota archaeon]|nr:phosphoglucosamine mutase [Candidatus Woesearchaeota archaeon]
MTRKLFGTDGIRGKANVYPMTPEVALRLGKSFAKAFVVKECAQRQHHHRVIIGKDTRLSGYMFETALTAGLISMGVDVLLVGPMPTPGLAHLTKSFAADAGIVISASHNPAHDNGIKFFTDDGYKLSDAAEEAIEQVFFAEEITCDHIGTNQLGKAYHIEDARGRYSEFLKHTIQNHSLVGLKIVLDCANGAAYRITPSVLRELGAEVIVIHNTPNGLNINDTCGALHPQVIRNTVLKEKADMGIALDGDADRVVFVDEKGENVDGDQVMALCAAALQKEGRLHKNTLVTTVMSNVGLKVAMRSLGITVVETDVGDRYVIDEMRKHHYTFGGEQSGHIIFGEYSTTGDGTLTALQVLRLMHEKKEKLSTLLKGMRKYPQVLINVEVPEKKPLEQIPGLNQEIQHITKELGDNGRLLVRYSGTEKKLRIMVEGKNQKSIQQDAERIAALVKKVFR